MQLPLFKIEEPTVEMSAFKMEDLSGDGKVTQADILKGRGVKLRKGGMPKKKGYAKGGKMNDMRKTGMFYGGMSRRGK